MPERRTHSKSRLGCVQCKSRRVKCDETYPKCGACKRRGEPCTYTHVNGDFGQPSSPRTISLDGSSAGSAWHELHLRELELMHQWSTETSMTFAWVAEQVPLLQFDVPRLAVAHGFLLDAVFAITSLHLAILRPDDAREFVESAVRYQTRAMIACRRGLENMGESECTAMFHCSLLLGLVALALRPADQEHTRSLRASETLAQLASLWRGTKYIVDASREFVGSATHDAVLTPAIFPEKADDLPLSPAHALLESLRLVPAVLEQKEVYYATIERLQYLYGICQSSLQAPSRFAWLVAVPVAFYDFVADRDPPACAITMLYAALLPAVEFRWWAKGISQELIDELHPVVSAAGIEYAPIIEWVTAQIQPHTPQNWEMTPPELENGPMSVKAESC